MNIKKEVLWWLYGDMLLLTNPSKWWRIMLKGATKEDKAEFEAIYHSIFKVKL